MRYEFGGLIFGGACFGNFTVPNVLHSGCKKYFRFFPLFLEFRDKLGESDKNRESRREKIPGGGGVLLEFLRGRCAARTLKPLAYTRASSSEFCYRTLGLNSLNPTSTHTHTPNYHRVAVLQKLLRSLVAVETKQNRFDF